MPTAKDYLALAGSLASLAFLGWLVYPTWLSWEILALGALFIVGCVEHRVVLRLLSDRNLIRLGGIIRLSQRHVKMEEVKTILLAHRTLSVRGWSVSYFAISLVLENGSAAVTSSMSYFSARRTAERLAQFLKRDLIDSSFEDRRVRRHWQALDTFLPDDEPTGKISPPSEMRSRLMVLPTSLHHLHIFVPASGVALLPSLMLMVLFGIAGAITMQLGSIGTTDWFIAMAILLVLSVSPLVWFFGFLAGERIKVDAEHFSWCNSLMGVRTPWRRIRINDIEEVLVGVQQHEKINGWSPSYGSPALMARSDRARITFGRGIDGQEATYLGQVLTRSVLNLRTSNEAIKRRDLAK